MGLYCHYLQVLAIAQLILINFSITAHLADAAQWCEALAPFLSNATLDHVWCSLLPCPSKTIRSWNPSQCAVKIVDFATNTMDTAKVAAKVSTNGRSVEDGACAISTWLTLSSSFTHTVETRSVRYTLPSRKLSKRPRSHQATTTNGYDRCCRAVFCRVSPGKKILRGQRSTARSLHLFNVRHGHSCPSCVLDRGAPCPGSKKRTQDCVRRVETQAHRTDDSVVRRAPNEIRRLEGHLCRPCRLHHCRDMVKVQKRPHGHSKGRCFLCKRPQSARRAGAKGDRQDQDQGPNARRQAQEAIQGYPTRSLPPAG